MRYWFSSYRGNDWTPVKGYNQNFRKTLALLEDKFGLRPTGTTGTMQGDTWVDFTTQEREETDAITKEVIMVIPPQKVRVNLYEVRWTYFTRDSQVQLRFRIKVQVRWNKWNKKKIFFDDELIVEFSKLYPAYAPKSYIKKYTKYGPSHNHHLWSGGELCILGDPKDWTPSDTIITEVNAALGWIVMHNAKFGY